MESAWSDAEAQSFIDRYASQRGCNEDLALRVYTSRLIGQAANLVLHGGGNTSVKTRLPDDLGEEVDVLCVKGSGWDLGDIEPAGLPAVRLSTLQGLRGLSQLSDEDMVNAQRTRLLDASAPNPSVETLLHAFLPAKFIDHSHADAILSLVDQAEAERICQEVYGDRLAIVPYVMPGFALSKLAAEVQQAHPDAEGLLLLRHGLFTWGQTAQQSYERHVRAVDEAEKFIAARRTRVSVPTPDEVSFADLAPTLRGRLGEGRRRYLLHLRTSERVRDFVSRADLPDISQRGTATPDHVIRTKQRPLLLDPAQMTDERDRAEHIDAQLGAFRKAYIRYVDEQRTRTGRDVTPLDPDPRVVLVPGLGIIGVGADAKAARVAADLYEHTVDVIGDAEAIGQYHVLPQDDLFDMEYWSLEQAKLGKKKPLPLAGRVVYVTGAAGGIGEAVARAFKAQGAALYLVDLKEEALANVARSLGAAHEALDVTDRDAVFASVGRCVQTHGALDGIVSNAGAAPQGKVHECPPEALRQSFELNFFAHQWVAQAATRVMRAQGLGGFLLFNASKAAFNPGASFGAYAMPKAALVALTKQYALEQGDRGIRSNAVNADRIRTGLLDAGDVEKRAAARGLDTDAYYRSNLLKREVTAQDVAQAFVQLALAEATTGSVVTVDGGNIAAAPR